MFCNKCGNEIKEGELFCSKCGNKIERQEKKNEPGKEKTETKKNSLLFIILGTVILIGIIACVVIKLFFSGNQVSDNTTKLEQIGANGQLNTKAAEISFSNMKSGNNNLNLDETQYEVLKYFDNNYFYVYNCEDLQRYPKIYKGAQVRIDCWIEKIIKSTEDEFICMGVIGPEGEGLIEGTLEDYEEKDLFVVKSKQLDERLIVDDEIVVYGVYNDVSTYEIDGKSYTVPVIEAINLYNISKEHRFDLDTVTKVAKYIFGNDIKLTRPYDTQAYGYDAHTWMYLISLDNQSNANFKEFCILQDIGYIGYTSQNIYEPVYKRLFITADFEHYIVTTYDETTKHLYIDYFDRDFKKIWAREFDYNSNYDFSVTPMDYTATQMALVVDNDLYLIDLETGENIIEPVLVGSKIRLTMLSNEILLIGSDNKDAIMSVGYDGKIIRKINADTEMDIIYSADTQIVNNKMVIILSGYKRYDEYTTDYLTKYIVLNSNGEVELSTKDTNSF